MYREKSTPIDSPTPIWVCLTAGINIFRPAAVGGKRVDNTHLLSASGKPLRPREPQARKLSESFPSDRSVPQFTPTRPGTRECLFGDKTERVLLYIFSLSHRYDRELSFPLEKIQFTPDCVLWIRKSRGSLRSEFCEDTRFVSPYNWISKVLNNDRSKKKKRMYFATRAIKF